MVFSGHMHGYERGFKNGVFYVTQGGGSYMDVSEPVGPTLYSHITVGTNKPGNMPGFNNGLVNHILTIDVTDSSAWVKLRYFDKSAKYLGVYDSFTVALKRDTVIADTGTISPNAPIYAWTLEGNGKEFKNRIAEPNVTGISYESNGVQGQAAKFNSSFMNLGYGSAATFGLPAKEMTVSCWVKASSFQTWGGLIGHIQDNGTYEKGWILGTSSNKFSFALKGTGSSAMTYLEAGTTASTNQWYHVVATYNGSAMKLYVNGTLAGSSTIQSGNIEYAPSSWFQLGAYKDDDENFVHQGSLDDVALWNRVLTDSEIAALASKQPIADLFTAIRADQVSVTESMNSSIRSIQVGSIANGVSLSLPEEGEIKLFQISGREVFQSRLQRGTNSLDLTALSTGVYLMSIRTVSGIVLNQKFVK